MGCDIHWLMERKDTNGNWHPICTGELAFRLFRTAHNNDLTVYFDHPVSRARSRNYNFFALLADVRNNRPKPQTLLYQEALPEDINETTKAWLHDDDHLHSPGWADPKRIKKWDISWSGWDLDDIDQQELSATINSYRDSILQLPMHELLNQQIIHMPFYTEDGDIDCGTRNISAHQRIEDAKIVKSIPAANDDNTRFFFAFDS